MYVLPTYRVEFPFKPAFLEYFQEGLFHAAKYLYQVLGLLDSSAMTKTFTFKLVFPQYWELRNQTSSLHRCYICVKYEPQNLSGFCLSKKVLYSIVIGCGKGVGPTKECEWM